MTDTFLVTYPKQHGALVMELNHVNDDGTITVTPLASLMDFEEFREWCADAEIIIDPHPGGTIFGLDMPDDGTAFHLRLRWA